MIAMAMPGNRPLGLVMVALALACASCSSPMVQETAKPAAEAIPGATAPQPQITNESRVVPKTATSSKGAQELERAVKSYEEGAYKNAARQFQAALDLGLNSKVDQATAHKYLAFITCVTGREKSCRDEFRKALDADPNFELGAAEVGHPVWGAAFRSVKAESTGKAKAK
jgi:Tfp pilus assembly protein PilF